MNEFEHLPVEGVGAGRAAGSRECRADGGFGGGCPGIACNKFYSVLKGGQFLTCTSLNIHL